MTTLAGKPDSGIFSGFATAWCGPRSTTSPMSWCLYLAALAVSKAGGDVVAERLSLTSRVLRGGWSDFARLGHVGHRGGIAGREHVADGRAPRNRSAPSTGPSRSAVQLLDQRGGGHPGYPRDRMGVDLRIIAEYDMVRVNLVERQAQSDVDPPSSQDPLRASA